MGFEPCSHAPPTAYCLLPTAYCLLLLLAGCSCSRTPEEAAPVDLPLAGVELKLVVAGDSAIAAAAERLEGEWYGLTQSGFQVETMEAEQLADAQKLSADAVICSAGQLGSLAERGLLAPLPEDLRQDSQWLGIFENLRLQEARWGDEIHAVPFGSPVLVCYYRVDLLKKVDRRPPRTWSEYRELAELLAELPHGAGEGGSAWCGTIEPLATGWAGLVLLARAAPYAKHRDNYATLFDLHTMQPLVAAAPFVRALEELVAAAGSGPAEPWEYDADKVRAAFWQGQCGMALSWPTGAAHLAADGRFAVGICALPGSRDVFDVRSQAWEKRAEDDDPRVPLLGIAGRVGVISRESAHPQAAARLLLWLAGKKFSPQVSATSRATTLFRQSHLLEGQAWVESTIPPQVASQYAGLTRETLLREQWLFAPRIPGRAEYLSALDAAVLEALRGERSPSDALEQAAARWREITAERNLDKQRIAYQRSLGLD